MTLAARHFQRAKSVLLGYGGAALSFAALLLISVVLRRLSIKLDLTLVCVAGLLGAGWYAGAGPGILFAVLLELATLSQAPSSRQPLSTIILVEVNRLAVLVILVLLASSRRKAEGRLSRLAAIVETSDDAIIGKTLDGVILSWNAGAQRIYGYTASEAIGRFVSMLLPGDLQDELPEILARLKRGEHIRHHETTRLGKDGKEIEVSLTITPITDRSGNITGASTIARNITERKGLEEQLRQAQKMEAIGRLAGGIAHDFNNLLTAILGYSQMAIEQPGLDERSRRYISEIESAGTRATRLTKQLLALARKQKLQPEVLDLNAVVGGIGPMLQRLIGEDVGLMVNLDPKLGAVKADPGQIEQVIMNLAVNARDAMPDGGNLTIDTANVVLDEAYAAEHPEVNPGPYALLAVSDNGMGMDADTQARIFEPFFTTKEEGRGTGLGLSIVFGIVKQSGGHVWVYSEPGEGTTFKVYLPLTGEAEEVVEAPAEAARTTGGSETVLLVEDEELVRKMVSSILRMRGYRVLTAADGAEATQDYFRYEDPIHLMITDVIMPRMSGRELADRLSETHPEMKVLYMSGYTATAVRQHGVLNAGAAFIQKPFTAGALVLKVQEMLGAGQPIPGAGEMTSTGLPPV